MLASLQRFHFWLLIIWLLAFIHILKAQSFYTLDSTEWYSINKTCLDYEAKKVMQPHFTPKQVGIFIYVLMVEGSRDTTRVRNSFRIIQKVQVLILWPL